jgi:hypothetical protein
MTDLDKILADWQRRRGLTAKQVQAIRDSLARYNQFVSEDAIQKLTDRLLTGVQSILNPQQVERAPGVTATTGESQATLRGQLQQLLDRFAPDEIANTLNLDFHIKTATDVAQGAGNFLQGSLPAVVEEYPAWELLRFEPRRVPRLWAGDEGTEDKTLGAGFESRWMFAAQAANDPDAARMLEDEERMIALKSSGIWQQLGEFDDGLGNPYPPFAFNSGMWTQDVSRAECERLGLLDPGEPVEPPVFSFKDLFLVAV